MLKQIKLLGLMVLLSFSLMGVASAAPTLQTLTILGANGAQGDIDPYTEYTLDNGATWHQAYLTGGHPWGYLPGTNSWINFDPNPLVGLNSTTLYRVRFNVPAGATNPTANIQVKADNAADISLNGTFISHIVGQGSANADIAFANTVHPGMNEITIKLIDWGGIVGFNYRVDLTVQAATPLTTAPASSSPAGIASKLKSDLVIGQAGEFGHRGKMGMLFGDGLGGFRLDQIGLNAFDTGHEVAVGDLNKDGKDDVVVQGSRGAVFVALGDFANGLQNSDLTPAGNFSEIAPNCCNRTRVLQLGDLNNDGNLDIAVVQWSKLGVMLGNGDGTFGAEIQSPAASNDARGMALGDLDGDGNLDLVATYAVGSWFTAVHRGNGDGTFQPGVGIASSALAIPNTFVRDADGDGDLDIYTGSLNGRLKIFSNDGSANFTKTTDLELGAGNQGGLLIVDDLNGDGTPDAVAGIELNGFTNVRVWLSDGSGGFVSADYGPVGSLPRNATLVDINADGIADIAMVTVNIYGGNPGSLWTMLGNGDGTFQTPTNPISTYRNNMTIAAGNFAAPAAPTNQPPTSNAGAAQILESTGATTAVTLNGSASSDPDGDALTYSWTWAGGSAIGVGPVVNLANGTYAITLTVDDGNAHTATATTNVVVQDTIAPTVTIAPIPTLEATRLLGADVNVAASVTATDVCGVSLNITPAGPYPLGGTLVSVTATDCASNQTLSAVVVTVVDTTAPVLSVPASVSVEANGVLSTVAIGSATATDIFGVTITSNAPATYPLGTTVVTWTATDANGNVTTGTQSVTVVDTTAPVLSVPASVSVEANGVLSTAAIGSATATDIFGVTITSNAPATYPLGTTVVTWTATDANGNVTTGTQSVTVVDTTAPTVTVQLIPVAMGDGDDEHAEGLFKVVFTATDIADLSPALTAVLNGATVINGQVVKLEQDDDAEVGLEHGQLEVTGMSFTLTVTAIDASTNVGTASASYAFPVKHESKSSHDKKHKDSKSSNSKKNKKDKKSKKHNKDD